VRVDQTHLSGNWLGAIIIFVSGFCLLYEGIFDPAYAESLPMGVRCGLPKTGQVTSYQRGDDGDYKKGWSGNRFINNGDGTITDNATGLMWVANPASAGVGGTYTWDDAIAACKNLKFAGYGDWRLPNIKELVSIVDYGAHNPTINTAYFTSQSLLFWSSTTSACYTSGAWLIDFSCGLMVNLDKTVPFSMRPVRDAQ